MLETHFPALFPKMFSPDLAPNGRGCDVVGGEEEEEVQEGRNGSRHQQANLPPSSKVQNLPR